MANEQVNTALEIAAEETTPRTGFTSKGNDRVHIQQTRRLRRSIIRFLENIPDDMTVMELRDELDATTGAPDA